MIKDTAVKLLKELEKQAVHFDEQLKMTQGGIQTLQELLSRIEEAEKEKEESDASQS